MLSSSKANIRADFVFLFLQFACLAGRISKVCVPVCSSESMWVFMVKLAVFPGVEAMLSLITMRRCALKPMSVYEEKEELQTALKSHAAFTHSHDLQIPPFREEKKKCSMWTEGPGGFQGCV